MPITQLSEVKMSQAVLLYLRSLGESRDDSSWSYPTSYISDINDLAWESAVPKPTEAQLISVYSDFVDEVDAEIAEKEAIEVEQEKYGYTRADVIIALRLMASITQSLGDSISDIYAEFASELVGSNLEDPIKAYVTKFTTPSITNFSPGISDDNKKIILDKAVQFLLVGLTVYFGKRI